MNMGITKYNNVYLRFTYYNWIHANWYVWSHLLQVYCLLSKIAAKQ